MAKNNEEINEFNPKDSRFYQDFIKPNLPKSKKEWVGYIMIILVVVTLGLVAVNQYLGISYKAVLIVSPCNLCEEYQRNRNAGVNHIDFSGLNLNLSSG